MHTSTAANMITLQSGVMLPDARAQGISKPVSFASRLKTKVEAFAWMVLAAAVITYGNGRHDLITVVLHHPGVWR